MKDLQEFLKVHEESKTALIDFLNIKNEQNSEELKEWKNHNTGLFEKISYGPTDLPIIADCNFDGIHFQYILTFHSLFQNSDYYYAPENVLLTHGAPLTVKDME